MPIDPALLPIDDMEDGNANLLMTDGRDGHWYVFTDQSGGFLNPNPFEQFVMAYNEPIRDDSGRSARFQGGSFDDWGAALALHFIGGEDGPNEPYDISRFSGITFFARALGGANQLVVLFPNIDTDERGELCNPFSGGENACDNHFQHVLELSGEWSSYSVLLEDLVQGPGEGRRPARFDAEQVFGVQFAAPANVSFDIWIDDLSFVP